MGKMNQIITVGLKTRAARAERLQRTGKTKRVSRVQNLNLVVRLSDRHNHGSRTEMLGLIWMELLGMRGQVRMEILETGMDLTCFSRTHTLSEENHVGTSARPRGSCKAKPLNWMALLTRSP